MSRFSELSSHYRAEEEEYTLEEYLKICKEDSLAYASAAERMSAVYTFSWGGLEVGHFEVQLEAEGLQPLTDRGTDSRAVLADPPGEGQYVHPPQAHQEGPDVAPDGVHEDVEGQPGPGVAGRRGRIVSGRELMPYFGCRRPRDHRVIHRAHR